MAKPLGFYAFSGYRKRSVAYNRLISVSAVNTRCNLYQKHLHARFFTETAATITYISKQKRFFLINNDAAVYLSIIGHGITEV